MPDDRFQPDASLRGITSTEDRGKRGDRLVIDDPHCAPGGVTAEQRQAARALFENRGPIGHVGRDSIPKSHRAEGVNYVD